MNVKYLNFIKEKNVVIDEEVLPDTLDDEEVEGHTVCSMISAGTEIHAVFLDVFNWGFPRKSGYTVVFQIERMGKKVEGFCVGDYVFAMACHQSFQRMNYKHIVKVPDNVSPQSALFCRMAGVSMATLNRTSIMPGEKLLVTGLGAVGLMAMMIYSRLGYKVIGVDPDENRRNLARSRGFEDIFETVPLQDARFAKQIGLALECSGHEAAVLNCCDMVRAHGEVSVIGVPWKACSDLSAHKLLHSVFYNYVKLYSGWEMDLPTESSFFVHHSMNRNYGLALQMMAEGKLNTEGLYAIKHYTQAQQAYTDIFEKTEKHLSTIFSWDKP